MRIERDILFSLQRIAPRVSSCGCRKAFSQLVQVERFGAAGSHSAVDHFGVGGVGEDLPHAGAAVAGVHQSLLFGAAAVVFGGVSLMERPDQHQPKPTESPILCIGG